MVFRLQNGSCHLSIDDLFELVEHVGGVDEPHDFTTAEVQNFNAFFGFTQGLQIDTSFDVSSGEYHAEVTVAV